jgi:cytochrome c556
MKILISTTALLAAVVLGANTAAAQSCEDVIKTRQTLMKRSGDMAKVGAAMVRGQTPYDPKKAREILAAFADKAQKLPTLFPDCSKAGSDTHAMPAIWEKPDEFKERIAKFAADVKTAQETVKDLDTFKASFSTIGKDCGACHETFRTKLH